MEEDSARWLGKNSLCRRCEQRSEGRRGQMGRRKLDRQEGETKASSHTIPSLSAVGARASLGLHSNLTLKSTLRWQPCPFYCLASAWTAGTHLFLVFVGCIYPFQATSLICVIIILNPELPSVAEESTGGATSFPEATLRLLFLKAQSSSPILGG